MGAARPQGRASEPGAEIRALLRPRSPPSQAAGGKAPLAAGSLESTLSVKISPVRLQSGTAASLILVCN